MRSKRQSMVLVGLLEQRIVEVLKADDFGVTTAMLEDSEPAVEPRKIDGRTITALMRKGLIRRGIATSPWTFIVKLTAAGRALASNEPGA